MAPHQGRARAARRGRGPRPDGASRAGDPAEFERLGRHAEELRRGEIDRAAERGRHAAGGEGNNERFPAAPLCGMLDLMTESVATLGAGKLLVFQPATSADAIALPVALGIQRFWGRRLKEAGRPSMYFVLVGKLERVVDAQGVDATPEDVAVGDKFVLPLEQLADDIGPAKLIQVHGARWGLVSAFALTGPRFHLESRLLEVQDGAVRVLERHVIDEDNIELPRQIFKVLASTTRRTGARAPWHQWSDAFTTVDEVAALHYLKAEGACSMVEEGARLRVADAFEPVVQALAQSPRMPLAVEVARTLTRVLGEKDVPSLAIARELRRLRELGVPV